jgi:hypothetical protein
MSGYQGWIGLSLVIAVRYSLLSNCYSDSLVYRRTDRQIWWLERLCLVVLLRLLLSSHSIRVKGIFLRVNKASETRNWTSLKRMNFFATANGRDALMLPSRIASRLGRWSLYTSYEELLLHP